MTQLPDRNLSSGILAEELKNDHVFEMFFKQNFAPICAYCQYQYGFDLDTAKDITHEGFIKLWEMRRSLISGKNPKAFLLAIISNKSIDLLRQAGVKARYQQYAFKNIQEELSADAYERLDLQQLKADIDRAVSGMPEQMRIIFLMSREGQKKYSEIAKELGISPKTVETQISRALRKLREQLSDYIRELLLILTFFY